MTVRLHSQQVAPRDCMYQTYLSATAKTICERFLALVLLISLFKMVFKFLYHVRVSLVTVVQQLFTVLNLQPHGTILDIEIIFNERGSKVRDEQLRRAYYCSKRTFFFSTVCTQI